MRPFAWFLFGLLVVVAVWVALQPGVWGPLFYPLRFRGDVAAAASEQKLDPNLVAAVIFAESGFRTGRVSSKDARGLMQLKESTAKFVAQKLGISYDAQTLNDPNQNIRIGTWYLRYLLDKYGEELTQALAAYNAGETVVDQWIRAGHQDIPYPETRAFVEKVKRSKEKYDRIYGMWYEAQ